MSDLEPVLGQRVTLAALQPNGDHEWRAFASDLPPHWACVVRARSGGAPRPVDGSIGWVYAIDSVNRLAFVTTSDFGRLPISDRMRPRYLQSLQRLDALLRGQDPQPHDADAVSEVKGMFNRIIREDQWDWFTVYEALGFPARSLVREAAGRLAELSRAIRNGDAAAATPALEHLRVLAVSVLCAKATAAIAQSTPNLGNSRVVRSHRKCRREEPARGDGRDHVWSSYAKERLDDANENHTETLHLLVAFLNRHGHRVEENVHVDAFSRLKSGPAIFEVKSITEENELPQVRHALSQLYEYRYRHRIPDASLWIVLSARPRQEWLLGYLEEDRDVRVIWREGEGFTGPSADKLTESGIAALRRRAGRSPLD